MQKYIGTKVVNAAPMNRGEYNRLPGWIFPVDENPDDEGYLVKYTDGGKPNHPNYTGYISWSPKDVFERAYRICDGMSFGMAIEAMKQGMKVSRKGWNGKGMYLWLIPATAVKSEWCHEPHLKELVDLNGGEIEALGTIRMYTVNAFGRRAVLTGWLASQSDVLSEDWVIVD